MGKPIKREEPDYGWIWETAVLGAFLLILLNSCASRLTTESQPVQPPDAFSQSGTETVPDRWWTVFEDRTLDSLVTRALRSNFTLRGSWSRLREARAVAERERASLWPDLGLFGEGEITRTESSVDERLLLGLSSGYEVDLWGRLRSRAEAEKYRARASQFDYQTAALSLSAEVTRTWYRLLEAHQILALIEEQITTNEKVLTILRKRFSSGQIRRADILRQRQLLESTREGRAAGESRIQVLEHQLAVLVGEAPQRGVRYSPGDLPELPPLPDTGVPVELLQRRPDVRAAFHALQAADRDLASAISNQFPRLSLSVSVSTADDGVSALFDSWAQSFAGNLTAPLLQAGRLDAEVDRYRARRKQRLYQYGQSVLTAMQEVENALIRESKQVERIQSIERQYELAEQTYERLQQEYFNGVGGYIDMLTALTDTQQLRRDLLNARLTLLEYRIALYRALAGGFETGREPEDD